MKQLVARVTDEEKRDLFILLQMKGITYTALIKSMVRLCIEYSRGNAKSEVKRTIAFLINNAKYSRYFAEPKENDEKNISSN